MKRRFLAIITMLALLCASIPAALPAMAAESEYQVDLGNGSAYTCSIGGAFSYDAGQKVGTLTRNGNSPSLTVYLGQKRAWPNENSPWYHVSYDVRIPEGADQAQWTLGNLPFQTPGSDGGWQGFIVTPKYVQDGDGWAIDFGPDNAASYEKRPADLREWTTIDIWLDCTSGESTDVYIGVNGELKGPYTSSYYVQELQSLAFSSNNVTDASKLEIRNVYAAMTESGPEMPKESEYQVDFGNGSAYYCEPPSAFSYDAEQKVGTVTRDGNSPTLSVFLGQNSVWSNATSSPWYHVSYDVRIPEGAEQAQWRLGKLWLMEPGSAADLKNIGAIVTPQYMQENGEWVIAFGPDDTVGSYEKRPVDLREWTTIDIWLDCTTGGNTDVYIGVNGELKGPYTSYYKAQELQSLAFSSNVTDASKLEIRNIVAAMTEEGPEIPKQTEYQVDWSGGYYFDNKGNGSNTFVADGGVGTITKVGNNPSLAVFLGQDDVWPNDGSPWYHVSYDVRIPDGAEHTPWTLGKLALKQPGSSGEFAGFIVSPQYVRDGDGWAITFGPDDAASYGTRPADLSEWTTLEFWLDCTTGGNTDVYIGVNGEISGPHTSYYQAKELQSLGFSSSVTDASKLQIRNIKAAMVEEGPEVFDYAVSVRRLSDTMRATATCGLHEGSGSADCRLYLASYDENDELLAVEVSEQFTLSYETPEQTLEADIAPGTKTVKAFLWDKSLLPLDMTVYQMPADPSSSLRVLAIGNSFSEDSMRWLYQIAADYGIEEIILGHLYIGGCSLEQHWGFANSGATEYTYYKNTDGAWQNTGSKSMEYGLTDEYWDIITLQQASGKSGMKDTYEPYLGNLVTYIDEHKLNPDAKLLWHMTWAYQSGSGNAEFVNYDNDQATMYHAICNAVQEVVLPGDRFDGVIPTGTAIQNVRTSYIGDTLTRDGSHLNEYRGRYIAGLMWFKALTGYDIDGITYVPNASEIDARALAVIKEAVNAAYATPYTVTPSSDAN